MSGAWTSIGTIVGFVAGFLANAVQKYLEDRRKWHHQWDIKVWETASSYSAKARTLRDIARRIANAPTADDAEAYLERFGTLQAEFREDFEKFIFLGSKKAIERARAIRISVYDLRESARKGSGWEVPYERLQLEQREFANAVRHQLRVPEGGDTGFGTAPLNRIDGPPPMAQAARADPPSTGQGSP